MVRQKNLKKNKKQRSGTVGSQFRARNKHFGGAQNRLRSGLFCALGTQKDTGSYVRFGASFGAQIKPTARALFCNFKFQKIRYGRRDLADFAPFSRPKSSLRLGLFCGKRALAVGEILAPEPPPSLRNSGVLPWHGMGSDGGWDGMDGRDGMAWDGMGGMGWHRMGWEG